MSARLRGRGGNPWNKEVLVAERKYPRIFAEGHPSHVTGTVEVACRVSKELYASGRIATWWVRWGVYDGCAYEGGCRFPTKKKAMEAFQP